MFTMLYSKYSEDNTDVRRRLNLVLFSFGFFFFFSYNSIQSLKGLKKLFSVNSVKVVYTGHKAAQNTLQETVLSIVTSYAVQLNKDLFAWKPFDIHMQSFFRYVKT